MSPFHDHQRSNLQNIITTKEQSINPRLSLLLSLPALQTVELPPPLLSPRNASLRLQNFPLQNIIVPAIAVVIDGA